MADNITILDTAEVEKTIATKELSGSVHANKTISINESGDAISGDSMLDIARGAITGMSSTNKYGVNQDIDTGTVPEDIWSRGGEWVAPTTDRLHTIKSSSSNDSASGTGIRTIQVYGLDANWEEQNEEVIMNGTSDVTTANTYVRIDRMIGKTAGSNGTNVGTITATAQTDGTVTAEIPVAKGQSQMAIYTVPAGYTAYMCGGKASSSRRGSTSAGQVECELRIRPNADTSTAVWRVAGSAEMSLDGSSEVIMQDKPYGAIPEKTDIVMRCIYVSDSNTKVATRLNFILVENE